MNQLTSASNDATRGANRRMAVGAKRATAVQVLHLKELAYCQKNAYKFLTIKAMKVANPIDRSILARIKRRGVDWVFSPADFIDLGTRHAVDKALSRMAADGSIRRVARGLYDVPKQHPIVGTTAPSIDEVAKAVAGKGGIRVQPTGAYAANLLGLSDQVPAKVVFLTDGRSKRIRLGKLDIVFRQTSPRIMATAGTVSGLVVQALRYLGKAHVNGDTVKKLGRKLSADDRKRLLKDLASAPAWIADIMRQLAAQP